MSLLFIWDSSNPEIIGFIRCKPGGTKHNDPQGWDRDFWEISKSLPSPHLTLRPGPALLSPCWQYLGLQPGLWLPPGVGLKVWLRRGVYPKCLGRHGLDRIIPCLLPQELPFVKTLTVCLAWGKVFPLINLFNQLFAHEELESLEVWMIWPRSHNWEYGCQIVVGWTLAPQRCPCPNLWNLCISYLIW